MKASHRIGLASLIVGLWVVGLEMIMSNNPTGETSARLFVIAFGMFFLIVGFMLFLSE